MSDTLQITQAPISDTAPRAYARFSRRLQAVMIDYMILTIGLVAALILATASNMTSSARLVGFAAAGAMLLYEPVLVSTYGGTLGHTRRNLRIIDDHTGGNVSFLKAAARFLIKVILGWFSFLAMATTQRHQALHDLWTNSTVQIRDISAARPHHFAAERAGVDQPGLPSAARRAVFIAIYGALTFVVLILSLGFLYAGGLVSPSCIDHDACTPAENAVTTAMIIGWVALLAGTLYLGWQGRLFGCRRKVV